MSMTRLGSFMGPKSFKDSRKDFNGISTVGFAKILSDNLGVDATELKLKALVLRAADKLGIPAFVTANALELSRKVLNGERRPRRRLADACAYALLAACRDASLARVDAKVIFGVFADMGYRVTKSDLFQIGLDSPVALRPPDKNALLQVLLSRLESDETILRRLGRAGQERGLYFRKLVLASQTLLGSLDSQHEGRNPRTIVAVSVYLASRSLTPRAAIRQREVAAIMGLAEYTIRDFVATVVA